MKELVIEEVNEDKEAKKETEDKLHGRIDKLNEIGKFNLLPEINVEKNLNF